MRARSPWLTLAYLVLAVSTGLGAAGCYAPTLDPNLECSSDKKCPDGYRCDPDGHCRANGITGDCNPKCDPASATPACDLTQYKCVQCLANTDCKDAVLAKCDTTAKVCVQCLADGDCPAGNLCVASVCKPGCSTGHPDCKPDAGSCDTQLGVCRGCLKDAECTDPAKPRCEPMNGVCVPCLPTNDNCPADSYCTGTDSSTYKCSAGCLPSKAIDCRKGVPDGGGAGPDTCCVHACVDPRTDVKNCGGCGRACTQGQLCCGGGCVDPMTSVANCGACGNACMPQNVVTATCIGGACGYDACKGLFGDCNKMAVDGCELPLDADVTNCGACGNQCVQGPHATSVACVGGACVVACEAGYSDCDGKAETGCEVHSDVDAANCGKCGKACGSLAANTDPACKGGTCIIGPCKMGFADCDANAMNGCEINLTNDPNNCGKCKTTCPATANVATTGCVNSACAVTGCGAGYGDCNKTYADGCESLLNLDAKNCAKCGNACPINQICNGLGGCIQSIAGGAKPPAACATGADPETANTYTFCQGDVNTAWITTGNGGTYHAQQICQQYGYTQLLNFGGTCGSVCAYCAAGFTCNANQVGTKWDGGGNLGGDQFGIKLGTTVHWQCGR